MNEPWTSYRFDYLERERINQVEDWVIENLDNTDIIASRIVFLETELSVERDLEYIRKHASCSNCRKYRDCGIGEEMRHSNREYEFNCCDWVGGRE